MSYVSKDELYDTLTENLTPIQQDIGKAIHDFEAQMAALELRVDRDTQRDKRAQVARPDFERLQEEFDEVREIVKTQGLIIKRMWAAIEELSLGADT